MRVLLALILPSPVRRRNRIKKKRREDLVHPREVFVCAIVARAAAIVLCHNHPSGDPAPSTDDRSVTEQLVAAGKLLDMPVVDHVIIGRGRYTSFAEAGLL